MVNGRCKLRETLYAFLRKGAIEFQSLIVVIFLFKKKGHDVMHFDI